MAELYPSMAFIPNSILMNIDAFKETSAQWLEYKINNNNNKVSFVCTFS